MAGLIVKLTQDHINGRKKQFHTCAWEIVNDAQRYNESASYVYCLDKETINSWRIDGKKKLKFGCSQ